MSNVKSGATPPPKMPVQLDNIPPELKRIPQWVVWSWDRKVKKDGSIKWDKPPVDAKTGELGSSTDESKWCDYDEAVAVLPRFGGLGLAMGKDGIGLIGVDLDECRDPKTGFLSVAAEEIIDELDTYAEISPSGTGVKLWLTGTYDKSKWRAKIGNIEVYRDGRYFTVTGNVVRNKPIRVAGPEFTAFLGKYLPKETPGSANAAESTRVDKSVPQNEQISRVKQAFNACMKVEFSDDEQDGSGRLVKYCRQVHRVGLGADECVSVVRAVEAIHPFPKKWTDEQIKSRYASATTQTEFGEAIKRYEQSDYGVAMRVRDFCNGSILYIPEWHKWVAWNGQMFELDRHGKLIDAIVAVSRQMMQKSPTLTGDAKEDEKIEKAWHSFCMHYQSNRGIENIERLSRSYLAADYRDLDKRTYLFYAENGTVNIQADGEIKLQPHCRSNMNTKISPVPFIVGAKCPRWMQFMAEITGGDEALSLYLQKVVGYCLTGIAAQEFFILHGGGNNGKGVFTRTLGKLLGEYAGVVNQDLIMASPNQHPTQFAYLYNKRCIIAAETDQDCRLNESQVKMLTGGDSIQCRRMREDFWEFPPTHKILLTTNSVPTIRGTDHGIWRRIKLVPFGVLFAKPDTELEHKLEAELPGILQWAIAGYRYLRFEGWTEPACVTLAKEEYRADMSTVGQFVEDMCQLGASLSTPCSTLYQSYKLYCEQHGHYVCSSKKLFIDLKGFGVTPGRSTSTRTRIGIALKSEFENEPK